MPEAPIVTLTTDFGLRDAYVGVMKGVVLGIAPGARLIDLSHEIAPQNITEGALLLRSAYRFYPRGTIHLVVVDPGVGTSRLPVAVETPHGTFVGPDNGIFGLVLADQGVEPGRGARAVELANPHFRLPQISNTFHGRDIFAPATAHLANGVDLDELGPELEQLVTLPFPKPKAVAGTVRGEIIHVDHFGNAVSNVPAGLVPPNARTTIARRTIETISTNYAVDEIVALIGSAGLLEVALGGGSAATKLGIDVGEAIEVQPV
ncbi:MAG: SAM hydrolase/SAM-dependent halogenase family protein [Chloroflexota bacterium]